MSYQVFYGVDVEERLRQKQANYEREFADLENGKVSPDELAGQMNFWKEFPAFKIAGIGGRPLR